MFLKGAKLLLKQNKTKQNKTKQNKTKQNKTKQNKTKQNKTKQNNEQTLYSLPNSFTFFHCFKESAFNGQAFRFYM